MTDYNKNDRPNGNMTYEDHERLVWKSLKEAIGSKVGDYEKPLTSYREEGEEMIKELERRRGEDD